MGVVKIVVRNRGWRIAEKAMAFIHFMPNVADENAPAACWAETAEQPPPVQLEVPESIADTPDALGDYIRKEYFYKSKKNPRKRDFPPDVNSSIICLLTIEGGAFAYPVNIGLPPIPLPLDLIVRPFIVMFNARQSPLRDFSLRITAWDKVEVG